MSIEMRERANKLLKEMTEGYTALQDNAAEKSMMQLKEAKENFGDDPELKVSPLSRHEMKNLS